jgi:ADP-heptose:LPS heptosyltransferase
MSLPLLRGISRWSGGRWPVKVLLKTTEHFELLREEGLDLLPLYYHPQYLGWRGLTRLVEDLRGTIDLIIGIPMVPAKKLFLLRCMIGARYCAGEAFPIFRRLLSFSAEKGWTKSVLATQEEIATCLGIEESLGTPSITLTKQELEWSREVMVLADIWHAEPVLGVHCSSIIPSKRWPAEFFGTVIRSLKRVFPHLAILSFGTLNEQADSARAHDCAGPVIWVEGAGNWALRESLALLSRCDLVISGDTGIMHMAAAVGTRTLSIFGPTSATRLAPTYNAGFAIVPETPCHPCYRDEWTNCECIRLIQPESVAVLAEECLKNQQLGVETW